ncbi:MAG TPA: PilN domain-containing protein [Azospirillaceae bacterium]|nr:PilN domain-containing protein [Azospirillaceae bacterium]
MAGMSAFERGLSGLLAWWLGELRALAPARAPLVAVREGEDVRVMARRWSKAAPVVLRLGPEGLLRRRLVLPAAAEAHLTAVLAHDLDAHTPWTATQAWFAAVVVGRHGEGREIDVHVLAVARAAVAPFLDKLKKLGLEPVALELVDGAEVRRVPLQAAVTQERRWFWPAVLTALMLAAAAGPLVARWRLADLGDETETLRLEAAVVHRMADAADRLKTEGGFADARKRAAPAAVVVLEVLSRLLPDDVWLAEWRLDDGVMQIIGHAGDAARLLPLIEESPHFESAEFRAPLVREDGGGERFHIAARVVPHAEP